MAIVTFKRPIEEVRGILKRQDVYYVRNVYGKWVAQRRPRCYSERQRAMRESFGARYSGSHSEKEVPMKSRGSPVDVP